MKFLLTKSETSVILTVFIQDSSSSTGAGLGSLDQTSSITGGYLKRNGTGVALAVDENVTTEGTYEAPTTAAQVRIGTPANMITGTYELHFHNDLFTTADWVTITLSGATNMAPLTIEVQLGNLNVNDGVRAGLTALPNAAADAAGGLSISDLGGLDLDTKLANTNEVTVARMGALTDWINGGRLDLLLDAIPTTAMRGTDSALTDKAGFALSATGADLILKTSTFALAMADAIWDEILIGATHNIATSAGKRLRTIDAAFVLRSGTLQAGSSNTATLDTGANASNKFYDHTRIIITEGTGLGQERLIVHYNGTTKVATVAPPWVVVPDATSLFEIEPGLAHAETGWATIEIGVATSATSTTIVLDGNASSVNDFYNDDLVHIDNGTGEGQVKVVTDYVGATKTATVHSVWLIDPDTTSEYIIEEGHPYINVKSSDILDDTADIQPKIGTPAADVSADIAAVKVDTAATLVDTNELQTDWTNGGRLDLIIDAIKVATDAILVDTGTDGVVISSAVRDSIATSLLDLANGIETGVTLRQAQRAELSAAVGKLSGAATSNVLIRDIGDTKNRVNATVDVDGNRSAVALDLS